MRNKFKVLISILVSFCLTFQSVVPVFANNLSVSDTETSIEYSIDDDIISNEEAFEEIASLEDELAALDELAQYYYDYYMENECFPEEDVAETYSMSVSFSEALSILSDAGITTTIKDLSTLAAELGILANLDGPLPALDLVACLLGLYFIATSDYGYSFSEIKRLYNSSEEAQTLAGEAVATKKATVRTNIAVAYAMAYAVAVSERNDGAEYFRCKRNNGIGGGVVVKEAITFEEAIEVVILEKKDVYCTSKSAASALASAAKTQIKASASSTDKVTIKQDNPHNLKKQPLNLPHYHIEVNGDHSNTPSHIFYPY